MVHIHVGYEGDLHCAAVHGPSGSKLATDAPKDNQGRGEAFSPTDLVATALGSCMLTIMGIVANRLNVNLAGSCCEVVKYMAAAPARRIGKLEVTFQLPKNVDLPDRQTLIQAAESCPVALSLHPEVEKVLHFEWIL